MTQRASNQENSLPTSRDLFGESPQQPSKRASGSKLGPKGGKHYVQPWGYYAPPGTGPVGETCKTCAHICVRGFVAGRYLKCLRARGKWTGGRKSDILAGSPACSGWQPSEQHSDNPTT